MGYWTRANSELCLIATKGKPKRESRSVHQVVETILDLDNLPTEILNDRVMKHSKKPDIVRDKIVELCGDLPRIELFAREEFEGWDCLGNEIDGRDIRDSLNDLINN